jgi:sugar O-acyltransferase (sialic acid O-acetyltransferase NeuD family)
VQPLVIFGESNILSDLFDAALACGLYPAKVVTHHPHPVGERDVPLGERVAAIAPYCPGGAAPAVVTLDAFVPSPGEAYLLGPTTPTRAELAGIVQQRFGVSFMTLVHPRGYASPLASLGAGVFLGANSVVASGTRLDDHVFVNRGVTIGHDNHIASFTRVQPGANVGGLSRIGRGVTIGIGATLVERLRIGDGAVIAAGAVVLHDVEAHTMVAGVPATVRRHMPP